jgi:hypothetical protein
MQLFGAVASPHAHGAAQSHPVGQSAAAAHEVVFVSTHLPFAHMKPAGPQSAAATHGNW